MDGWIDELMDQWMVTGRIDGWMDGCWKDGWWIYGRWMSEYMGGWVDEWMNRWMEECMETFYNMQCGNQDISGLEGHNYKEDIGDDGVR